MVGVDPLGQSRRRRGSAARRRSTTGCPRRGSRGRSVTPTSRMRAGNGPGAPARDGVERSRASPRARQPAQLEDGRVEALDVADLERDAARPGPPRRARAPPPPSPRAASPRGPARPRSIAARASGAWAVVGAAMTTASSSGLGDHGERVGEAGGTGLRHGVGEHVGVRVRDRGQDAVLARARDARRWLRPIEPRPARPTRSGAVASGGAPGRRPSRPGARPRRRRTASRIARRSTGRAVLVRRPGSGRHRDRQDLVGEPVRDRQVEVGGAGHVRLEVGLPVDRDRVVDEGPDAALRSAPRSPRCRWPGKRIVYWCQTCPRPSGTRGVEVARAAPRSGGRRCAGAAPSARRAGRAGPGRARPRGRSA